MDKRVAIVLGSLLTVLAFANVVWPDCTDPNWIDLYPCSGDDLVGTQAPPGSGCLVDVEARWKYEGAGAYDIWLARRYPDALHRVLYRTPNLSHVFEDLYPLVPYYLYVVAFTDISGGDPIGISDMMEFWPISSLACASQLLPGDGKTVDPDNVTLFWTTDPATGCYGGSSFDVEVWTGDQPHEIHHVDVYELHLGGLEGNTTYSWLVKTAYRDHAVTQTCDSPVFYFHTSEREQDVIPPEIICPSGVRLAFGDSLDPTVTGLAAVTDNRDPDPVLTHSDVAYGNCPQTIVRTWKAQDDSGNVSTCRQEIEVTCPSRFFPQIKPVDLVDVTPIVLDWNGDGIEDLVLGQLDGSLLVVETVSGLHDLQISSAYKLAAVSRSGGVEPLKIATFSDMSPRFDLVDWDQDGAIDIVAFDRNKRLVVYKSASELMRRDAFRPWILMQFSDGSPLETIFCDADQPGIRVLDWHGDGERDLLLAAGECFPVFGRGDWPHSEYVRPSIWNETALCAEPSKRGELELFGMSGYGVVPWAVDWDSDSVLDALIGYAANTPSGTHGRVVVSLNQGTNRTLDFDNPSHYGEEQFLLDTSGNPIGNGRYATVCPLDANKDGRLDLLVGGDGPLTLYLRQQHDTLELLWEISWLDQRE